MTTVVCFGDSITRGQISANFIDILWQRMGAEGYRFINAGVNNDLTYNLLKRMDSVTAVRPDFVTIYIGTNDMIASLDTSSGVIYQLMKGLPRKPDTRWAEENAREIVRRLKTETNANIGLASIPPLGEDLDTRPNQRVQRYNEALRQIAEQEGVSYLPVYERQVQILSGEKGPAFHGSVALSAEFVARRLLYREGFDEYSRRKGFEILIDSVHMNSRGARAIAREIEIFLRRYASLNGKHNASK